MKAPLKLFVVLGIACAFASPQVYLASRPSPVVAAASHDPAPLPARPLPRQPWMAGDPAIFLSDESEAVSYAWTDSTLTNHQITLMEPGGAGFAPQWQQLMHSLDMDADWRLAFNSASQTDAPDLDGPDTSASAAVPEPAGYLMLLTGLAAMALLRRVQLKSTTGA